MSARRDLLFPSSLAAALLALGLLYWRDAPLRAGLGSDAYHHMAAVRELSRGRFPPEHDLIAGVHPQGHYGPYLVALGAFARWTGMDPVRVLYLAGLANLALFALALRALALRLLGPGAARWSALAALLLWGPLPGREVLWPSKGWPGTTSLADPQNFFYPHQAGLVLLVVALLLLCPAERAGAEATPEPKPATRRAGALRWAGALFTGALLVATHALAGLALLAAVVALAMSEALGGRASRARVVALVALPAAALVVAALWPYFPVLGLLRAFTVAGLREPSLFMTMTAGGPVPAAAAAPPAVLSPWAVLGPAAIGAVAVLVLARRRRPFLLAWTLLTLLLAFLPWIPLRRRFLFFAALPLQLGAAALIETAWRSSRAGRFIAAGVLGVGAASAGQRVRFLLMQERADFAFVSELTPADAVVLSDPATSNGVAGLGGRKVVAPESPDLFLVMAGGWQRRLDADVFLRPGTSPTERDAILRRWGATHVLVDELAPVTPGPLPYPILGERGGYVLYDARSATR